jgi:hypothetical protein
MDWPDSPTEYNRAIIEEQFRDNSSEMDQPPSLGSERDCDEPLKANVRYTVASFYETHLPRHVIRLADHWQSRTGPTRSPSRR